MLGVQANLFTALRLFNELFLGDSIYRHKTITAIRFVHKDHRRNISLILDVNEQIKSTIHFRTIAVLGCDNEFCLD